MAFKNSGTKWMQLPIGQGDHIMIDRQERLDKLEKKIKLVAAAQGKTKGQVICDALESYLPRVWAEILKTYREDR